MAMYVFIIYIYTYSNNNNKHKDKILTYIYIHVCVSVVVTRGSTWQLSPWWWEKMHARCLIPDIIIRHMGMKNQAKVWYEPNKYEDHHIWIYGILWDIQYIYIYL